MSPFFAADSIGKSFRGRRVLNAASVWASSGSVTLLLGRNGCGKSTLLRIGAGVLAADFGVVRFAGEAWERPRLDRLARRGLFYLPDRGLLSRGRSLREHVQALTWRFGCRAADAVLADLGLDSLLDEPPETLSGGERRRAELALALVRRRSACWRTSPWRGSRRWTRRRWPRRFAGWRAAAAPSS